MFLEVRLHLIISYELVFYVSEVVIFAIMTYRDILLKAENGHTILLKLLQYQVGTIKQQ